MLGLIFIILGIYWVSVHWGEDAGVVAIFLAVGGLIWLGCSVSKRDRRAWNNRQEYWSKDGAERARLRKQWAEEAERREKTETIGAEGRCGTEERWTAGRNPVRTLPYVGSQTEMGRIFQTNNDQRKLELFVCPKCGREVRSVSRRVLCGEKYMREYECPRCRMVVRTGM